MANNWVKDGLDAYLSLTGEHRAEKKAEADLAAQEHTQSLQDQSMQLAQSQDARAAASAGLSNQESELRIKEGTRKATDISNTDNAIRDFITMKTAADPSIPNVNDPVAIAAARQGALDLAHTGAMLNNIPPGAGEFTLDQLPASAQKVLMEGPGKAAGLRTGTVHTDPATGGKYTMTGQMGKIRYVREEGKPAIVIPTMLAQNEDGTMREVPYTDGTNDPNVPIKHVTAEMMNTRAGSTLSALDQAEKTGISPAVAYSENVNKMVLSLPYEQRVAWLQGEVSKETSRREKHIADVEVAKAAEPYAAKIEALTGTSEEKRTAAAALMIGAPSVVVDHLLKTSKSVHDMFPDAKDPKTVSAGTGKAGQKQTMQYNEKTGKYDIPVGGVMVEHAPAAAAGDKDLLQSKRDVATRLREAQRGYQTAVKKGNPDAIAEAADYIEALNADAKTYGVPPLPVPNRPMTSDEETALYDQATTSVRSKQGKVARAIGIDPNKQDIETEFQKLKQQRPKANRPGIVTGVGGPSFPQSSQTQKQQAAPPQQPAGTLNGAPPAAQHNGRIVRDTTTGKRYQSNGTSWAEVQ